MKKVLICHNCGTENPFHNLICTKCNAFLRTKIANIDLWDTLWKLLDSPIKTAENIIHAEHKNFVITILVFTGIEIGISFLVLFNALHVLNDVIENSLTFISLTGLYFIGLLCFISFLITALNNKLGLQNRFKDNLALYSFSFLPIVITLVILTPIQIALYGTYWFTFNPSPLIFKPLATYILFFIEGLFYLWSVFLIVTSTYSQSKNILYSISIGVISIVSLLASVFYLIRLTY